jgi:hypothetical protein
VLLESEQRVGRHVYVKARYNRSARSRIETQGIPQYRSRRVHQRMGCMAETFPLRVIVHPPSEFQVANRQNNTDAKDEGRSDREQRKERMPVEVHTPSLNSLRRGAQ